MKTVGEKLKEAALRLWEQSAINESNREWDHYDRELQDELEKGMNVTRAAATDTAKAIQNGTHEYDDIQRNANWVWW